MKNITNSLCFLLIPLMFTSLPLLCQTLAEVPPNYYEENAGSIENPYQISNLANLRWLSETEEFYTIIPELQTFTYYIQTADIYASETATWNNERGFIPIGKYDKGGSVFGEPTPQTLRTFFGCYNGNNYSIFDLYIWYSDIYGIEPGERYEISIGLFGVTGLSEFINIHLENISYNIHHFSTCAINIGSLIGHSGSSFISNCSTTGNIVFDGANCNNTALGGLIGYTSRTIISNCYTKVGIFDTTPSGNLTNSHGLGGLVGKMMRSHLINSYYYGNINKETTGNAQGGLIGYSYESDVDCCYVASGSNFNNVKGLFGRLLDLYNYPINIANTFWDFTTTGTNDPYYSISQGLEIDVIGLPTDQMKQVETYIQAGWDFEEIWAIDSEVNSGYPYIQYMSQSPTNTSPIDLIAEVNGNQIVLFWQPPAESMLGEVDNYIIYRNNIYYASISNLMFMDYRANLNETVTYGVSAVYNYGFSRATIIIIDPLSNADETIVSIKNQLLGNYPNPFNPSTTISFNVASAGNVIIEIYNIKGQKISTICDNYYAAGSHTVVWNGLDETGQRVSSGVYFYQMQAGGFSSVKKMVMVK